MWYNIGMKTILLLFFLVSCGKESIEVKDITVMGDSMAAGVHYSLENNKIETTTWWKELNESSKTEGIAGAPINYLLTKQDRSNLKTVIVFMGFNNLKHQDQSIDYILNLYQTFLNRINSNKIICVGVPYVQNEKLILWYDLYDGQINNRIEQFNLEIKNICENYIDTSDVETVDGIHPDYNLIIERIRGIL
jgi:hypothetical protein